MNFDEIIQQLSSTDQKSIKDMMSLFEDIDHRTESFSKQTGLKCKNGCGACCENPNIETTAAEMLPLAAHLWAKGLAEETIQSKASKNICVFYQPDINVPSQGRCGIYAYRPGICRLFGFAARRDKYGTRELVTCKIIKDSQPQDCKRTQEQLPHGLEAPLLTDHAMRVSTIDPVHGVALLPINQAIGRAIEKIGYCIKIQQKLPVPPK